MTPFISREKTEQMGTHHQENCIVKNSSIRRESKGCQADQGSIVPLFCRPYAQRLRFHTRCTLHSRVPQNGGFGGHRTEHASEALEVVKAERVT